MQSHSNEIWLGVDSKLNMLGGKTEENPRIETVKNLIFGVTFDSFKG